MDIEGEIERIVEAALQTVWDAAVAAERERWQAREKTLENTARINLKVAQDRGAEIERLQAELAAERERCIKRCQEVADQYSATPGGIADGAWKCVAAIGRGE